MTATVRWPVPASYEVTDETTGRRAARVGRDAELCFETLTDPAAIDALGAEWSALSRASGRAQQVFQTFEWLAVWRSLYLGDRTRAIVVTGRNHGRLVFLFPLVIESRFGLRILSGMGEPLSQYCDAIVDDAVFGDAERDAALDHLIKLPVDLVWLRRVRDDAALAASLQRRLGPGVARQIAPMVDLAGIEDVAAFHRRYSGKLRANRNRRRRRLQEHGSLTFDHFGPSAEAAALVRTALRFKREWARRRGILAPFLCDPRFEGFFVEAAGSMNGISGLRVSALRRGSDTLGIEISVLCHGRLFGHVLAPNPDHLSLGVGGVLAEMTILNALERRYTAVDLMAPADPYKLEWATASMGVGEYVVPLSAGGRFYARVWVGFGRDVLKRIARRAGPRLAVLSRRFLRAEPRTQAATADRERRSDIEL